MTNEEILEGNKLIAKFMGLNLFALYAIEEQKDLIIEFHRNIKDELTIEEENSLSEYIDEHLLPGNILTITNNLSYQGFLEWFKDNYDFYNNYKFHNSWDWLMPVVEKIMNIRTFGAPKQAVFKSIEPNIATTYQAVVNFIKWYNEVKNV